MIAYKSKLRKVSMHQELQHFNNLPMQVDQEPIPITAVKLPETVETE